MVGQMVLVVTIMSMACFAGLVFQSHILQEAAQNRALAFARTFSAFGAAAVQENLYQLQESMPALQKNEHLLNLDIIDPDRMISVALHPSRIGTILTVDAGIEAKLATRDEFSHIEVDEAGHRRMLVMEPLRFKTGELIWVRVEYSLAQMDQLLRWMVGAVVGVTVLLATVMILAVSHGLNRIAEVLRSMMRELNVSPASWAGSHSEVSQGEIERLFMAVREANHQLTVQQQELRDQADLLERRVEERTAQLAEARDQALEATKLKAEFLATMSHEIRTPMNAIVGMAELLQETPLSTEQQDYVGRFSRAATSLLDLINDILDISKIEAGHLDLESIPFDIHHLVDQVAELMAVRAHARQLELIAFVHPNVPTWVLGDTTRLRQVFVNLAGNAIKFTERGEVVIRVELDEADPTTIRCSVSDTGIGIPADKVGVIFESFTQVDSSTTRRYGGTGLGLSISKRLVELMGGHIAVKSEEGVGSIFSFVVPLHETSPLTTADALPALNLQGFRLLVVDDNETNRKIVREQLRRFEPMIIEAANGAEALVALDTAHQHDQRFDVVILDYQMPGMDGLELAQAIRERKDCPSLPLVMHSSDMRGQPLQRARELGIASYVYKPVSRRKLLESLSLALRQAPAATALQTAVPSGPELAGLAPLRILLVEDLEDNRAVVRLFLKNTPHLIEEAENGSIGVEMFQAGRYDLVLMDIQMPVMDGLAATAAIRAWEQAQHRTATPILALTANAFKEEIDKSLAAGCIAHLTKPMKKKTLLAAIAQYAKAPSDLAA